VITKQEKVLIRAVVYFLYCMAVLWGILFFMYSIALAGGLGGIWALFCCDLVRQALQMKNAELLKD